MSMTVEMLRKYRNHVFIETGSKQGECAVSAITLVGFEEVHTIELDQDSYDKAKKRIAGFNNINLYLGDSADWLPRILEKVTRPYTVWLDAHPLIENLDFNNTPILQELNALKNTKLPRGFKILMDDLRLFSKDDRNKITEMARSIGTVSFESQPYPEIERDDILVIM